MPDSFLIRQIFETVLARVQIHGDRLCRAHDSLISFAIPSRGRCSRDPDPRLSNLPRRGGGKKVSAAPQICFASASDIREHERRAGETGREKQPRHSADRPTPQNPKTWLLFPVFSVFRARYLLRHDFTFR